MIDTFLDQPMKSVIKMYIAGEILQVYSHAPCATATQYCYQPLRITIAAKILLVYPKLELFTRLVKKVLQKELVKS
jgi:homoserine kinase